MEVAGGLEELEVVEQVEVGVGDSDCEVCSAWFPRQRNKSVPNDLFENELEQWPPFSTKSFGQSADVETDYVGTDLQSLQGCLYHWEVWPRHLEQWKTR